MLRDYDGNKYVDTVEQIVELQQKVYAGGKVFSDPTIQVFMIWYFRKADGICKARYQKWISNC